MGVDANGHSVGSITYQQDVSDPTLDRANFKFNGFPEDAEVILESGELRQVKAAQGVADIVELVGGAFEIRYYAIADVGSKDGSGYYTFTGSPVVVHKLQPVTDPVAGAGYTFNETRGGVTVSNSTYNTSGEAGNVTRMVDVRGRITETTTATDVDEEDDDIWSRYVLVNVYEMVDEEEVLISARLQEYESRPWGEVLLRTTEDPAGLNMITQYGYYDDEMEDGYGRRKWVINPDGSWEKYDYDDEGKILRTFYSWLDLEDDPEAADFTNSRCVEHGPETFDGRKTYESITIGGGFWRRETTHDEAVTTELIGDQPVQVKTVVVSDKSYDYSAFESVTLTTKSVYHNGRLYQSYANNGTTTTYDEEVGTYVDEEFEPDDDGAYIRRTRTEGILWEEAGVPYKTGRTVTISGAVGTLREEYQVCTGTGTYETVSVTEFEYEASGRRRLLSVTKDGSVMSSTTYTSSLERTEVDAYGVATTYTANNAGDLISTEKVGVSSGTNHEAQADVTTTYETEGLVSTVTTTSGVLSTTRTVTRDLIGRVVSLVDEQGRETTWAYTNGGRTVTETGPGGVTRITNYYPDGQLKSITGTGVVAEFHEYDWLTEFLMHHTIYFGTGDNTSPRWKRIVTDAHGNVLREDGPGPNGDLLMTRYDFASDGKLRKKLLLSVTPAAFAWDPSSSVNIAPLLAPTLYEYDSQGRIFRQGVDLDINGTLDLTSSVEKEGEPIIETTTFYEEDVDGWWQVDRSRQYLKHNNASEWATTISRTKLGTGSGSVVQTIGPDGVLSVSTTTVDLTNKKVTTTADNGLSSADTVQVVVNGLLISQSSHTVSSPVLLRYDALARPTEQVDPRTSESTIIAYNSIGQVTSVTDGLGHATTYTYYGDSHANAGQLSTQTNAEEEVILYAYDSLGRLTHQWGSGTYPQAYTYSAYGEMTHLKTFRQSGDWSDATLPDSFGSATPSTTVWAYHAGSGLLTSKTDAASEAVAYTYYDSGLLETRTWARGVVTTYGFDTASRLTSVVYSDGTPGVSNTYRRDGQLVSREDAAGQHEYTYAPAHGVLTGETVDDGLFDGLSLSWPRDGSKRPSGFAATLVGTGLTSVTYGYDAQSRLQTVSASNLSATYGYTTNSDLLHTTTLKRAGATKLTGSRTYDDASRLDGIAWVNNSSVVASSHGYTYDDANRRTRADLADGSYWVYTYNDRGEVESGVKKNGSNTLYPGHSYGYTYDMIGNRATATVDAAGGGSRTTTYTPNALNQYTGIANPAYFNVTGTALSNAAVEVNGNSPERLGPYFRKELGSSNSSSSVWEPVEVEVTLAGEGVGGGDIVTTREGHHYVPKASETLTYDEDGNLTSDGRWIYAWDGENRLKSMETASAAVSASVPKRKLEFIYDGMSRRVKKEVFNWNPAGMGSWASVDSRRFIYNEWNTVGEVDDAGVLLRSQVWGMDISGTMQGAGGVGGLLWMVNHQNQMGVFFVYDVTGNVTAHVETKSGARISRYDYNAFGETIISESTIESPWKFSTKIQDVESGIYYYGYRYYDSRIGRWLARDPIEERGGVNIYGMISNDPINHSDYLGLQINICLSQDVIAYFKSHNLTGPGLIEPYTYLGSISGPADTLESEILLKLVNSSRSFSFVNLENLKKHVAARVNVVDYLKGFAPGFGGGDDQVIPGWKQEPMTGWVPKSGSIGDALIALQKNSQALVDCSKPGLCAMTHAAIQAGINVTSAFGANFYDIPTKDENDWVPGDGGALQNMNRPPQYSWAGGENIVYLGAGEYMAHPGKYTWATLVHEMTYGDIWKSKDGKSGMAPKVQAIRRTPMPGINKP